MIEKLKAIAARRTKTKWKHTFGAGDTGNNHNVIFGPGLNQWICRIVSGSGNGGRKEEHANAEFIAMASNCFDELLAVVEATEAYQRPEPPLGHANLAKWKKLNEAIQTLHAKIKTELGE